MCIRAVILLFAFGGAEDRFGVSNAIHSSYHPSYHPSALTSREKRENSKSEKPALAFAFGPGGLLCPYYFGIGFQLRDLGLIKDSTPLGGASAGAVVASALAFDKEESQVIDRIMQFMEEARNGDSLKSAFRRVLEDMVPEDAPELAQRHGLAIGYREVFPSPQGHVVTSWQSKDDFIETVLASMNFPFFFSRWPLVRCRDAWAVDGLWSVEKERHGCPPLEGDRTIAIFATPQEATAFDDLDIIQPGQGNLQLPDGMDMKEWNHWMVNPAPPEKVREMVAIGRAHAKAWAVQRFVEHPFCFPAGDMTKLRKQLSQQKPSPQRRPLSVASTALEAATAAPTLVTLNRRVLSPRLRSLWPLRMPRLLAHTSPDDTIITVAPLISICVGSEILFSLLQLRRSTSVVGTEPLLGG